MSVTRRSTRILSKKETVKSHEESEESGNNDGGLYWNTAKRTRSGSGSSGGNDSTSENSSANLVATKSIRTRSSSKTESVKKKKQIISLDSSGDSDSNEDDDDYGTEESSESDALVEKDKFQNEDDFDFDDNSEDEIHMNYSKIKQLMVTVQHCEEAAKTRLKSLARYRNVFKPFISEKKFKMLSNIVQSHANTEDSPIEEGMDSKFSSYAQPAKIINCKMRDYQIDGYNWLIQHFRQRVNCILGDEMGLGKTLQSIAFIAHLLYTEKVNGPFLFVVPLSVLFNWIVEFQKWCPSIPVLRFHATDAKEIDRLKSILSNRKMQLRQVIVTTYDMIKQGALSVPLHRVVWRTVFLDEGHRVRNENLLSKTCASLRAEFKVILTGTPLQNNLREMGGLLKYLAPDIFDNLSFFENAFSLTAKKKEQNVIDRVLLDKAHYIMRPFLLRRIKSEVEQKLPPKLETKIDCPLTPLQIKLTQFLLFKQKALLERVEQMKRLAKEQDNVFRYKKQKIEEDTPAAVAVVNADVDDDKRVETTGIDGEDTQMVVVPKEETTTIPAASAVPVFTPKVSKVDGSGIRGLLAHLRKAANHPFLFDGLETPSADGTATKELITVSGKMLVLDALLQKLASKGHRVVLFSQYTHTLDIIGDYLDYRGYKHDRLDGSTNRVMREVKINLFNKPQSKTFIFCLTTRAGGEGVNLYTADTVILFDSDWNPQVDIQAMARVHRIGQTKTVHIYRLVTKGSVEECIVHRAQRKLFLDSMVNRGSTSRGKEIDKEIGRGVFDGSEETEDTTAAGKSLSGKKRSRTATTSAEEEEEETDELFRDTVMGEAGEEAAEAEALAAEEGDEDALESTIFATLKFGWNSAFSMDAQTSRVGTEEGDAVLSDEMLDIIVDRTRGLSSIPSSTTTSASTAATTTVPATVPAAVSAVPSTSVIHDDTEKDTSPLTTTTTSSSSSSNPSAEQGEGEMMPKKSLKAVTIAAPVAQLGEGAVSNGLLENQEVSVSAFDESVPLIGIEGLRDIHLNQLATTMEEENADDNEDEEEEEEEQDERTKHSLIIDKKRERKARVMDVHVDGVGLVPVLKETITNLQAPKQPTHTKHRNILDGFSELKKRPKHDSFYVPPPSTRMIAGRDFQHQDICQVCWDGGTLICCDFCPMAYHTDCIGLKEVPKGSGGWSCPQHACASCNRRVSAAALLFRCEICAYAYCEDCLPAESVVTGECERFAKLGYRFASNACYVKCSIECVENEGEYEKAWYGIEDEKDGEEGSEAGSVGRAEKNNGESSGEEEEEENEDEQRGPDSSAEESSEEGEDDLEDGNEEEEEVGDSIAIQQKKNKSQKSQKTQEKSKKGTKESKEDTTTDGRESKSTHKHNKHNKHSSKAAAGAVTAERGTNQSEYDPSMAIDHCYLSDMKTRLQRDDSPVDNIRFLHLSEIPNFDIRLQAAHTHVRSFLLYLIQYINEQDKIVEAADGEGDAVGAGEMTNKRVDGEQDEESKEHEALTSLMHPKSASTATTAIPITVSSFTSRQQAKVDAELLASLQPALQFRGISTKHSVLFKSKVVLAVLRMISKAEKFMVYKLAALLGIMNVTTIKKPSTKSTNTGTDTNNNTGNNTNSNTGNNTSSNSNTADGLKQFDLEPKFTSAASTKRVILEEALAVFLVILSPRNLLLPPTTTMPLPKSIDGMFYTTRLLQALGEPMYDPNNYYFVTTSLLDQRIPQLIGWQPRYVRPVGVLGHPSPADAGQKLRWLWPIVRWVMKVRQGSVGSGRGSVGSVRGSGVGSGIGSVGSGRGSVDRGSGVGSVGGEDFEVGKLQKYISYACSVYKELQEKRKEIAQQKKLGLYPPPPPPQPLLQTTVMDEVEVEVVGVEYEVEYIPTTTTTTSTATNTTTSKKTVLVNKSTGKGHTTTPVPVPITTTTSTTTTTPIQTPHQLYTAKRIAEPSIHPTYAAAITGNTIPVVPVGDKKVFDILLSTITPAHPLISSSAASESSAALYTAKSPTEETCYMLQWLIFENNALEKLGYNRMALVESVGVTITTFDTFLSSQQHSRHPSYQSHLLNAHTHAHTHTNSVSSAAAASSSSSSSSHIGTLTGNTDIVTGNTGTLTGNTGIVTAGTSAAGTATAGTGTTAAGAVTAASNTEYAWRLLTNTVPVPGNTTMFSHPPPMQDPTWRTSLSLETRQHVLDALKQVELRLIMLLRVNTLDDFALKLRLHELALLCLCQSAEEYEDITYLPQRLAAMLTTFNRYALERAHVDIHHFFQQ